MSERTSRRKSGGRAGRREARAAAPVSRAPFIKRSIPYVEILNEEGLALIEQNADQLLAEVGIEFLDDPEVLNLFKVAGADVNGVVAAMLAERFTGIFHQVPPDFSAKKVGGQRAYAAARRGDAPKLEPRPVEVHEIALVEYAWPIATVEVSCEKGFYVRSLARDLGTALGTGGHCASIRRTAVGPFGLENAVGPDDLPEIMPDEAVLPLEDALAMLTD